MDLQKLSSQAFAGTISDIVEGFQRLQAYTLRAGESCSQCHAKILLQTTVAAYFSIMHISPVNVASGPDIQNQIRRGDAAWHKGLRPGAARQHTPSSSTGMAAIVCLGTLARFALTGLVDHSFKFQGMKELPMPLSSSAGQWVG